MLQPQQKRMSFLSRLGIQDFKQEVYTKKIPLLWRGGENFREIFDGWFEKFDYKSIVNRQRVNVMALQKFSVKKIHHSLTQ